MPWTFRQVGRAAILLIGLTVAALLGLVAVSRGDAANHPVGTSNGS